MVFFNASSSLCGEDATNYGPRIVYTTTETKNEQRKAAQGLLSPVSSSIPNDEDKK